jgi:P4 family phage/plasmid primase-like protien
VNATLLTSRDDNLGDLLAAPAALGLGNAIRYDHSRQQWYAWSGIRWQADRARVFDLVRRLTFAWWRASDEDLSPSSLGNEDERLCALLTDAGWLKRPGDFRKALMPLFDTAKKESVLRGLANREGFAMHGDEWDRNAWQLGCANGIVDLRDGSFSPVGDPSDLITLSTGIEYDPDAPTPCVFLQNLAEITAEADGTPDPETANHLLKLLGYALWGDKSEEVFAEWIGHGGNGKGKLKDILLYVLGDYAHSLPPGFYTQPKWGAPPASAPRPELLDIQGKRIAFDSEPEGGELNIWRIKKHAGRDQEKARDLYGKRENYVAFIPSHLIVLLTNDVLKVDKVDPALERRLLVYPFDRRFDMDTEPVADTGRLDAMKAEARGILKLLVYACGIWYREGLADGAKRRLVFRPTLTERMKLATGAYLAANDPFRAAIESHFVRDGKAWEGTTSLYQTYQDWYAQALRDDPDSAGKMLTRLDFKARIVSGYGLVEKRRGDNKLRGFGGIRSKPFADRPTNQDDI